MGESAKVDPTRRADGERFDPTAAAHPREGAPAEAPLKESADATDSVALKPAADSLTADTTQLTDTIKPLTAKQLRARAKAEKRRVRDSIRAVERGIRDSLDSIKRREQDSIQAIRDSLLRIKVDSIIAKRIAESSRRADEEKARIERIKQRSIEREHR